MIPALDSSGVMAYQDGMSHLIIATAIHAA